jgi:Holliday junction resolvasome RuvABC endonuclease subunit
MYFIGIDFSINYASFCISEDFRKFWFGSVVNDPKISKKNIENLISIADTYNTFYVDFINREYNKKKDYNLTERLKLINYINISSKLIELIKKILGESKDVIVGIEGLSYGSKGASTFDIPMATGILRQNILTDILDNDISKFFTFSPSELKMSIGCKGNASKVDIFDSFIVNPIIENFKDNSFYNFIIENKDNPNYDIVHTYKRSGDLKIESPYNDMIDAYLSIVKIYNLLKK